MSSNHLVNMWSRMRRALDNILNNYIYNANSSQDRDETPMNLSPRFLYSRPSFLQLNSKEDIESSNDHLVRPILTPHKNAYLCWMAGYAECVNSGKSKYNEDQASSYEFNLPGKWGPFREICKDIPITYFGVFDGHGGYGAALHASKLLHKLIENNFGTVTEEIWEDILGVIKHKHRSEMAFRVTVDDLVIGAIEQAFLEMDDIIGNERYWYLPDGGCTALVVVMFLNKVYVANAGDCRAIHCKGLQFNPLSGDMNPEADAVRIKRLAQIYPSILNGKYTWLLYEHKPKRSDVGKPILFKDAWSQGWLSKTVTFDDLNEPIVSGKGKKSRLLNTIAVSRGFGDHDLMNRETKVPIKPFLSPRADVRIMNLNEYDITENDVIVLATDGFWENVTNEETAAMVHKVLTERQGERKRYMAVATALTTHGRGELLGRAWRVADKIISGDDVSVFVIPLQGQKERATKFATMLQETINPAKTPRSMTAPKKKRPGTSKKTPKSAKN